MYIPGCRLRVEVLAQSTGQWLWAEYDNMTVESENNYYTLHVTGYHGDSGDAFNDDNNWHYWQSNGMSFSTPNVDNDRSYGNCASEAKGGWWFNWCSSSSLNVPNQCWYSTPPPTTTPIRVDASRMMLQCGAV